VLVTHAETAAARADRRLLLGAEGITSHTHEDVY
jgi:hypothetical protein